MSATDFSAASPPQISAPGAVDAVVEAGLEMDQDRLAVDRLVDDLGGIHREVLARHRGSRGGSRKSSFCGRPGLD